MLSLTMRVFVSYKWEVRQNEWVKKLATDLRRAEIDAALDVWEVRLGDSFTQYMTERIQTADVVLFVITSSSVAALESPGRGGALKFEMQLAAARKIAGEAIRIIPIYREGEATPSYLRDHRYIDFRDDSQYKKRLKELIDDLLGHTGPPPLGKRIRALKPAPLESNISLGQTGNLREAGWGAIFSEGCDRATKEALRPLLDLRQEQAADLYREFDGNHSVRRGESVHKFLARHDLRPGHVDPKRVPRNLLIVGDPDTISFSFQQQLAIQYKVGRLHFNEPEQYADYARSVVKAERGKLSSRSKRLVLFGSSSTGDRESQLIVETLVQPLAESPALELEGWQKEAYVGEASNKNRLVQLLGESTQPRLIFITSLGLVTKSGDHERQLRDQGAIVCSDWPGHSWKEKLRSEFYFSGSDLPADADLTGTIVFCFGSYGAGSPRKIGKDHHVAPKAFVSNLAQHLLSHPNGGALAFIGHVSISFQPSYFWPTTGHIEAYEHALRSLMEGQSLGDALRQFSRRYAEVSSEWSHLIQAEHEDREYLRFLEFSKEVENFMIIGDPAARMETASHHR